MAADVSHCHRVVATFAFDMPPSDADSALGFVRARLNDTLLRHSLHMGGVMLSYSNEKLLSQLALVHDYFPLLRVHAEAECLVFRPEPGTKIVGSVMSVGRDHIALLVLGAFNAVIPISAVPEKLRPSPQKSGLWVHKEHDDYQIQHGTPLVFTVLRCEDHFGFFGITGSLQDADTGPYWRLVRNVRNSIGEEAKTFADKEKASKDKEKDASPSKDKGAQNSKEEKGQLHRKRKKREGDSDELRDAKMSLQSSVGSMSKGTTPIVVRGTPCPWGPRGPGEQNGWSAIQVKVKVEKEDLPTGLAAQTLVLSDGPTSQPLHTSVEVKKEAPEFANGAFSQATETPPGKRHKKQHNEVDSREESGSQAPQLAGLDLKLNDLLDRGGRQPEEGVDGSKKKKKKKKKKGREDGAPNDGGSSNKASLNGTSNLSTIKADTSNSVGVDVKLKQKQKKKQEKTEEHKVKEKKIKKKKKKKKTMMMMKEMKVQEKTKEAEAEEKKTKVKKRKKRDKEEVAGT
ncbi:unnamed protein product [Ostreobium quekettii]|uniref:RPA43 OB domain-containing protein n=1 Tax=Ostreobium quekettii TaxID=121088 RepID=A0A8S1ITP2_9CHLO|nr:unnamed protein product [Ostreobium quekettii]|eukprot:evm.model.scf_1790.2 EVM.evm.TU.scf_1790.2   scf_1790:16659-25633(+)